MPDPPAADRSQELEEINRTRVFVGTCRALLPTAFSIVLVSNILNRLKAEFTLPNHEVGRRPCGGCAFRFCWSARFESGLG